MWDSKNNEKKAKEKEFVAFDWGGGGEPAPLVFKNQPESTGKQTTSDGTIGNWDQFNAKANVNRREENEETRKAQGKGTAQWDESRYTTKLDKSELSEEQKKKAQEITKEILESEATGGIHHALERGDENYQELYGDDLEALEAKKAGLVDKKFDDADLYSDVQRADPSIAKNNAAATKAPAVVDEDDDDDEEEIVFQPRK